MAQERLDKLIAQLIDARLRCLETGNTFADTHTDTLRQLANLLPHGSGIDAGVTVDLERSHLEKIVLNTAFHHMDEHGFYDGWTEHTVTVTPSFLGDRRLRISGPNRNDIKEYLHQTFDDVLGQQVEWAKREDGTVIYRIVREEN